MWLPLIALALVQTAPDPSAEALALGRRLAATGTLAALLPTVTAKEREEMIAEHPEWSDADKAEFRALADERAKAGLDRLTDATGRGYAARLSIADLRALVAFNEGEAARHWREATPGAVMDAMKIVGEIDYKGEIRTEFCARTGKGCAQP